MIQNTSGSIEQTQKPASKKIKTLIFILQISFVITLLVVWFSSKSLQESKHLLVLFFYSFPAEFLIPIVPHEPVLIYFGKFYPPLIVALVAISSTLMTELLNYSAFKYIVDLAVFQKLRHKKTTNKIIDLFKKAPFAALWVAALTPIPFYPFRFLVVIAKYPRIKYLLALFLSRTPRFIFLAWVGYVIKIPDYLLILLFIAMVVIVNYSIIRTLTKKEKKDN